MVWVWVCVCLRVCLREGGGCCGSCVVVWEGGEKSCSLGHRDNLQVGWSVDVCWCGGLK